MKYIFVLILSLGLFILPLDAQMRVIDATDHLPVSAASAFDAMGNMVGFTWNDGVFSDIPESAYPITVRCLGYEQFVIAHPEDKVWPMIPKAYELEELVVIPVKRNVLKQTFYVREYYSMNTQTDTVTIFQEHMARRLVPTSKDAKFGGNSDLQILDSRSYKRFKVIEIDSVPTGTESLFPSMLSILELNDEPITVPESFKDKSNSTKLYEEPGKSGKSFIQKQNSQSFTTIEDALADKKGHVWSPWPLKLVGYTMQINQLYMTHAYRVNDQGVYLPKDLMEASFVMGADGRGKYIRKIFQSDKPVAIYTMIEVYVVDRDYLTKEEAKEEYKNKPTQVEFVIPSSVPALNKATARLVERAKAQANP